MTLPLRALFVEDSEDDAKLLLRELKQAGFTVTSQRVESGSTLRAALRQQPWDLVLSDWAMPGFGGLEALAEVRASGLDLPVIMVSGTAGEDTAVSAMRAGASDFLVKDRLTRLGPAVTRELREATIRQARRASDEQVRLLSHAVFQAPVSLIITDTESRIEYTNPKFTQLTGYTFEEARGQPMKLIKSGLTLPAVYAELWRTIRAGGEWRGEMQNRKKDGALFWELVSISPIRDDAGKVTHYLATTLDISERKEARQKIHQQGELLDAANETIVVADLDNCISFWNRGAERLLGWTAGEMLGKPLNDLFALGGASDKAAVHAAIATMGDWRGEICGYKRSGDPLVMEMSVTVLRDEAGQPTGRLSIGTDITEKAKLAEQFLRTQRLEAIGALSSGISHDLNNILAPILLLAPLLRLKLADPSDGELLDMVEQSAQRGATIVRQLLTFGRGIEGERVPVALRHLIREMSGIMRETFPRDITCDADVAEDLRPVMADATQIHQVLMNLCVNARDAMSTGGKLTLTARNLDLSERAAALLPLTKAGCYVVLTVGDTGHGIAPEIVGRIFEPFFTTKEIGKGTGFGLSTVLGIVKSHGGFVTVESKVGHGTEFKVYLPAVVDRDASVLPMAVAERHRGQNELVLVVDDEVSIRTLLGSVLKSSGYRVLTAADGKAAMEILRAHPAEIRLIVTDLMMPIMGGLALIREAQALEPGLKYVAMTGLGDTERREELASLGVVEMALKPFGPEEILSALSRQLRKGV